MLQYNIDIDTDCVKEYVGTWNKNGKPLDYNLIDRFYKELLEIEKRNSNFVAIDIGAQVGAFTLLAKKFPQSKWYAYEPFIKSYNYLQKNIDLNNITNITVSNLAISNCKKKSSLKIPGRCWGCPTMGDNPPHFKKWVSQDVLCDSLDSLYHDDQKIDVVKIDAEGAEVDILEGMKNIINKHKPTILLEVAVGCLKGFGRTIDDIILIMNEINYKATWSDNKKDWKTYGGNIIIQPN